MFTACSVCRHENRTAIDRALIAGAPLREIALDYGPSRSAVHRHRAGGHVQAQPQPADITRDPVEDARLRTVFDPILESIVENLPFADSRANTNVWIVPDAPTRLDVIASRMEACPQDYSDDQYRTALAEAVISVVPSHERARAANKLRATPAEYIASALDRSTGTQPGHDRDGTGQNGSPLPATHR